MDSLLCRFVPLEQTGTLAEQRVVGARAVEPCTKGAGSSPCNKQEETMNPSRKRAARDVPQPPSQADKRADVRPDEANAADQPQVPPATPQRIPDETLPDGGLAEHPIHDDDLEDRDSADYERDLDEISETDEVEALDVTLRKQG
jgi:hypothetical protein